MRLYNTIKNGIYSFLYWMILFIATVIFHNNNPLDSDEGIILAGAWRMLNNDILYLDFFEFISPGSFYLIFFTWKTLGTSYFTANFICTIILFLSAVGIYKIIACIQNNISNYYPPLIFILSSFYWPLINHNLLNTFSAIWAIYYLILGINELESNTNKTKYLAYSGLSTSLAILFLHSRGFVFCAANIIFILLTSTRKNRYSLLKRTYIYALSSLAPLLIMLLKWDPNLLYSNLIIFPTHHYIDVNKVPLSLFFILLSFTGLTTMCLGTNTDRRIKYLLYIQFIFTLSTITRPDIYHISLTCFPLYILLLIKTDKKNIKLSRTLQPHASFITSSLIIIISAITIKPSFSYAYSQLITQKLPIFYDLSTPIISDIKKTCSQSQYIYAGPFAPGLYFESRKLIPSKYSAIITGMHPHQVFIDVKNSLLNHQPNCAVLMNQIVDKFNYNKDNAVDNFIHENYKSILEADNYSIYKKRTN